MPGQFAGMELFLEIVFGGGIKKSIGGVCASQEWSLFNPLAKINLFFIWTFCANTIAKNEFLF